MSAEDRLSRMQTMWSLVIRAHNQESGLNPDAQAARRALLLRYRGAAQRYLLGALRDADAAGELFQDFAVRFMRGDFHRADPDRGRFRDFLRTALSHLVANYRKRNQVATNRRTVELPMEIADQTEAPDSDAEFLAHWRADLLAHAWEALADLEAQRSVPFHTLLRAHCDSPNLSSTDLAQVFNAQHPEEQTLSAAYVRKCLERARRYFTKTLVDEVGQSLASPTPEGVLQELTDLGLLPYCQGYLTGS